MPRFTIITVSGEYEFELHAKGCSDLTRDAFKRRCNACPIEADTTEDALDAWHDEELTEMGWTRDMTRVFPCAAALNPTTPTTKITTPQKGTTMKKPEIVTAIIAAYDLTQNLSEADHALAQDVLTKNEDGKKIRTTAKDLEALLGRINDSSDAPAEPKTVGDLIDSISTDDNDLSDPEHDAKVEAERAKKAKDDAAEAKRKAAADAASKKKTNGSTAKSVLSTEGLTTVGKGLAIFTTWKGTRYDATLLPTGKVVMAGTEFSSPFNCYNKGIGAYRNGWKLFVFDKAGTETPIDALRVGSKGFVKGASRSGVAGLENKIAKRTSKIERLTKELAEAKESVKTMKADLKEAKKVEKAAQKKSA